MDIFRHRPICGLFPLKCQSLRQTFQRIIQALLLAKHLRRFCCWFEWSQNEAKKQSNKPMSGTGSASCRPGSVQLNLWKNMKRQTDPYGVLTRLLYIMLAFFEHFSEAKALSIIRAFQQHFPRKINFSEKIKQKLSFFRSRCPMSSYVFKENED